MSSHRYEILLFTIAQQADNVGLNLWFWTWNNNDIILSM